MHSRIKILIIYLLHLALLLIFISFSHVQLQAKDTSTENLTLIHELERAKFFVTAYQNDSATVILTRILSELKKEKQENSLLGLEAKLLLARSMEQNELDTTAIEMLLNVVDKSERMEAWMIYTRAYLILANLHENLGRDEQSLVDLRRVKSAIVTHRLDSLYPRYAGRMASWHRIYGNKDSSFYYTHEVLRTAPEHHMHLEEGIGHMLMSILLRDSLPSRALTHCFLGADIYKKIEDYTGVSYLYLGVNKVYYRQRKYQLALAYNDSALVAARKSILLGNPNHRLISQMLQMRGKIFRELGKEDSAWIYMTKGYEMELDMVRAQSREKVIEVDARYNDEKKLRQIEEEKKQKLLLGTLFGIALLFIFSLSYFFLKLRTANYKTQQQAIKIAHSNEELATSLKQQIMLQGEIHHRVKNNLQVLISLLEIQQEDISDSEALKSLEAMANRIYSMAAIHDILYQKEGTDIVSLLEYTQNLCSHFSLFMQEQNKPIFQIKMDNKHFNLETLMPLGIILNELLTNSLKYAVEVGRKLKIEIQLLSQADGYCISFRDNGPGFPEGVLEAREGGLGSYLLRSMSRQLNGYMESSNDGGAAYKIFFQEKNKR